MHYKLFFSNPLGRTVYSQKDMEAIPYAKFGGRTGALWGIRKQSVGRRVRRAPPPHLFLTLLLYGAQTRVLESKIPPYVLASERPHSD